MSASILVLELESSGVWLSDSASHELLHLDFNFNDAGESIWIVSVVVSLGGDPNDVLVFTMFGVEVSPVNPIEVEAVVELLELDSSSTALGTLRFKFSVLPENTISLLRCPPRRVSKVLIRELRRIVASEPNQQPRQKTYFGIN